MIAPVMAAACSLQRKAITAAIAAGGTARPRSRSVIHERFAAVSMTAGSTALTRTPSFFTSAASTCVSLRTPALATAYAAEPSPPSIADREPTLTMLPVPRLLMRNDAARHDHQ